MPVWLDHRVVAEATVSSWLSKQHARHDAVFDDLLTVGQDQRRGTHEGCAAMLWRHVCKLGQ